MPARARPGARPVVSLAHPGAHRACTDGVCCSMMACGHHLAAVLQQDLVELLLLAPALLLLAPLLLQQRRLLHLQLPRHLRPASACRSRVPDQALQRICPLQRRLLHLQLPHHLRPHAPGISLPHSMA